MGTIMGIQISLLVCLSEIHVFIEASISEDIK